MLMYKQVGKDRWDNAYKWTTDEFIEFLSMFPKGTPIHSDLYIHTTVKDNEAFNNTLPDDWGDYPGKACEIFQSSDGHYSMLIPQVGEPILYIQEGNMPVTFYDMFDGKGKNLIKKAYDLMGQKKFLGAVFDVILEGDEE